MECEQARRCGEDLLQGDRGRLLRRASGWAPRPRGSPRGTDYPAQRRRRLFRVLFVGTTGAGKTSLLRQLIDSDPDEDRFPSTAPAKTTIADIEIVQREGPYQAVVTFFTEFQIQASIEECIADACSAAREDAPEDKIAERFLNHRDQKFRLSYVLGGWREVGDQADETDEFSFDEEDEASTDGQEESGLGHEERARNQKVLQEILSRIAALSEKAADRLASDLGIEPGTPKGADREAVEELIEEHFEAYLVGMKAS